MCSESEINQEQRTLRSIKKAGARRDRSITTAKMSIRPLIFLWLIAIMCYLDSANIRRCSNNGIDIFLAHAFIVPSRTRVTHKLDFFSSKSNASRENGKFKSQYKNVLIKGNTRKHNGKRMAAGTATIPMSDVKINHESGKQPKSQVNDFQPTTMSLTKSMVYFVKYLSQQSREDRIKNLLSNRKKRKFLFLFGRSNRKNCDLTIKNCDTTLIDRLQPEVEEEEIEKKPLRETLTKLNKARKEMIELVGYNASLLIPCFGFAGLAAFMNSVIPHYYGLCINCLASAGTTTQADVVKAISGLAGASFLCALFTGARGALFWLAGKYYA